LLLLLFVSKVELVIVGVRRFGTYYINFGTGPKKYT